MTKLLPLLVSLQSVGVLAAGGMVTAATLSAKPAAGVEKKKEAPKEKEAPPLDPRAVVSELFDGNDRFMHGVSKQRDVTATRTALAQGQHPKAIVLSCADSRVSPELVFDETLGDLFVVRNAGNVADTISLASMEYAAEHLRSPVLVVMGHERCGAVTAAAAGAKMDSANLQALVDEIAPGLAPLKGKYQGAELVHLGVEANVTATAAELLERSPLLKKLVEEGRLNIVRAVYEIDTGHVRWLDLETGAKEGEKTVAATEAPKEPSRQKSVEAVQAERSRSPQTP